MKYDYIKLVNGNKLPKICFGTDIVSSSLFDENNIKQFFKRRKYLFKSLLNSDFQKYKRDTRINQCIQNAINVNCIFFDTSRAYDGSEKMLGKMLSNHKRTDYYICTKLKNQDQLNDKPARVALQESLNQLALDYVDLYLLHWPVEGKYLNYWKQLEELYKEGIVKAIGVSNCKIHHLEEIRKIAEIMPMVNEVELHPLLTEVQLRKYCEENNIQIMAYTSTARLDFRLRASKRMKLVCEKYNKTLSQIILRWHIQNNIIPIFNTSTLKHLKTNMDIFDFELSSDDMKIIESMNINARTRYDSDNCEFDML